MVPIASNCDEDVGLRACDVVEIESLRQELFYKTDRLFRDFCVKHCSIIQLLFLNLIANSFGESSYI